MNRFFIAAMMALFTMPIFAQDVLEPEFPVIEPPMIFVPPSRMQDLKPIELTGYETSVRVTGFVCQTEITMTFYNPNRIQLAGDLVFPLPEGVTVSGYALDIEGAMVDAVAVTKEKARVTLEKEMRRGADPGIVERQRGNQFKTRIFPLPVQGTRTVKIQYVTTAAFDVEKGAAVYRQPVRLAKPVKNYSMTVDVIRPVEKPTLVSGDLGELNFGTWSEGLRAEVKKENFQTDKDIVLEIPLVDAQTVRVEKSEDGFAYFAIAASLKPEVREAASEEKAVSKNVAVYWDCSGSRSVTGRAGEQTKELAFLTAWLKANKIESVRLIPVRNTIEANEIQTVKTDELVAKISALPGDGATNLSAIESVAKEDELALLFTDGFATWGDQTNLKINGRLFAFSSGTSTDATYLKRITAANGGKYINLEKITTDNAVKAFDLALTQADSTVRVEAKDAQAYPSQLDKNTPAAVQFICGRTDKANAVVELKSTDLRFEIKVDDNTVKGETLRTMYAQTLLAELELSPKENQTAIEDLGKTFCLTTSETSLIVLESLEQYLEHGIEPPKSQPKLREAYLAEMQLQQQQNEASLKEKKEERYAYLSRIWKERTEWYNKKFELSAWSKLKQLAQRSFGGNAAPSERRLMDDADAVPEVMEERVIPQMNAAPAPAMAPEEDGVVVEEAAADEAEVDEAFDDVAEEAAENSALLYRRVSPGAGEAASDDDKSVSMEVKQWQPDSPYLKIMSASDDPYSAYLAIRGEYDRSPSFYLECAEFFKAKGDLVKAVRVLSNLAEMDLEAPQVLRVLGYRLLQYDNPVESVPVFESVLKLRPEEPQSYRDLAIALTRRAEVSADSAKEDYSRALNLYQTLIWGRDYARWDDRFGDVELFALEESNAMLEAAKKAGVTEIPLDKEFIRPVDVDVRIVMTWSADNTDIDLWVIEPSGEKVFYGHRLSAAGGMISRDFTGGYGPEEYMIHKAPKGKYTIKAHYYASHAVELLGAVTVQADVYTNFGRPNQKRQSLTFPLKEDGRAVYDIGEITFGK